MAVFMTCYCVWATTDQTGGGVGGEGWGGLFLGKGTKTIHFARSHRESES